MKFTIIHPTRRPEQAYNTMRNWTEKAADWNNFNYVLSVDYGDRFMDKYIAFSHSPAVDFYVCTNYNTSAIQAINYAAKYHFKNDVLIVVSDDTDCPEHWDTLLLKALEGKTHFCAKTDDGLQPTLITMPLMDKAYYEWYGYVYENGYKHLFADQELTTVAIMTGKYIKLDLKFPHNHYSTGKTAKDDLNIRNNLTWKQGEDLFNERLKTNFGIENPLINYTEIKWR